MSPFAPTDEQYAVLEGMRSGDDLTVVAGAGTGKSTTMRLCAEDNRNREGIYLAFNAKEARRARDSFPRTTQCSTVHALANRIMLTPERRRRLKGDGAARQTSHQVAAALGIPKANPVTDTVVLTGAQVARIAAETVETYCRSGDDHLTRKHLPTVEGLREPEQRAALAAVVGAHARAIWADYCSHAGRLQFTHDAYLKAFQLTRPRLNVDYLIVDEAQDSNGVTQALIADQQRAGIQVITVGDPNQSIYEWRGAISAMDTFGGRRLTLSQSFRFGPAVAEEANKWLDLLGAELRLIGSPRIPSAVGAITDTPDAILCRGNAEAVTQLIEAQEAGLRAHLIGGGKKFMRLAQAAQQFKERGSTTSFEFAAFTSWSQVVDYVKNDHGGEELAAAVKLVEEHGASAIVSAIESMAPIETAELVISTAHQAKGGEWARVRVADDFEPPRTDDAGHPKFVAEELRLAYVTVTRAKRLLDRGSLEWVDKYAIGEQRRHLALPA